MNCLKMVLVLLISMSSLLTGCASIRLEDGLASDLYRQDKIIQWNQVRQEHHAAVSVFDKASSAQTGLTTVHIREFGGSPYDDTDDSAAFRAALEHLRGHGGGTLLLESMYSDSSNLILHPDEVVHTYLISEPILINQSNVTIRSDDAATLENQLAGIRFIDNAMDGRILDCIEIRGDPDSPISNIRIKDIYINANYLNQPGSYNPRAIDVDHATQVTLEHLMITDVFVGLTFGLGVRDSLARHVLITRWVDDAFNASGDGITGGCSDIAFQYCSAISSLNDIDGGIPGTRNNAWEIEDGAKNITLEDCEVSFAGGNGFAVRNHYADGDIVVTGPVTFNRCRVYKVAANGFYVTGGGPRNRIIDITLNECEVQSASRFDKGIESLIINSSEFNYAVVLGPASNAHLVDSALEHLTIWAHDMPPVAGGERSDITLVDSELSWPLSVFGPPDRVTLYNTPTGTRRNVVSHTRFY